MRCLAVCQDELVIRMLDQILAPTVEVEFLVESRALARKLQAAGLPVVIGDPKRTDTYLKADVSPQTCIIIEDSGRRYLPKTVEAIRDGDELRQRTPVDSLDQPLVARVHRGNAARLDGRLRAEVAEPV